MSSLFVKSKTIDIHVAISIVWERILKHSTEWFPEFYVVDKDNSVDWNFIRMNGIKYVATIEQSTFNSRLSGTMSSVDNQKDKLRFEWIFEQNPDHENWTRITMHFNEPSIIKKNKWWNVAPLGAISLLILFENGFANIQAAYANSYTMSIMPSMLSDSTTAITSTTISKKLLTAIMLSLSVAAGGGIFIGDAYYSDPFIEYSLYPTQLPAELHGALLTVNDVYSTDNKSEILHYDCDNESIIHELDYTFDCIAENSLGNKETVTTTIYVKEPVNLLGADATDCISQHYMLSNDITKNHPYLLDLPHVSPTYLSNLKQDHKKLMDDYYESHDYVSAKKHATIVLKYFDANEVQTLSTMGNILRDEDRSDLSGTQCAVVIHSTPHLYNTVWGKLSLAEDYHVLGNYNESIRLSSLVIDNYEKNNSNISEISYANALTIKANALYRQALDEQSGLDDAKMHYTMAHDIRKSYDTWFGLGNIDRQEERFVDALYKYQQAKLLVKDTDEIDKAINYVSFASKKV